MTLNSARKQIELPLSAYNQAMQDGDFARAIGFAAAMIDVAPDKAAFHACRGEARFQQGDFVGAAEDFAQAHTLEQSEPQFLARFGDALTEGGDPESAEACYLRALQFDPHHLNSLLALGRYYERTGRPREASHHILTAVQNHTDSALACHAAGRFMHQYGSREEAAQFFAQAIRNDPTLPEPYRVLAGYLREAHDYTSAITLYDTVLQHHPGDEIARAERAHCLAHINDWEHPGYRDFDPQAEAVLNTVSPPFLYLPLEDDPQTLLARCKGYAARQIQGIEASTLPARPLGDRRLKVGYFSADFHDHATMHLLAGVLEAHDKDRFEIHAYSHGPDKQDHMRARAVAAVEGFHDVSSMADVSVAQMARAHELDIAMDLKGFTANARMGLFAHRMAPVQMTWLGFPGSTGAPCIDHILADDIVIPSGAEAGYSENVIRLPGCYQPNDRQRPLPDPTLSRLGAGLPEEAFVFCSFNNVYKISPQEFDIWMALLREVEDAVFWQLIGGAESRENLCRAAEAQGVDPKRLIFAPRLPQGAHLSRLAQADLFLDTFNCNAHTTASDALWAGVPVVTVPGQQFAARVAASLVTAAGTPETICADPQAYYDMALGLAKDREALKALRQKLLAGRDTCRLFDTAAFTRDFEAALLQAHGAAVAGQEV